MTTRPRSSIFGAPDALTDNVVLGEYLETVRRLTHAGAVELGVTAAEVEARLRGVSGGITVGGLAARQRARQVAKAIDQSSEALAAAAKWAVTAYNRFEAAYSPELEAAGARKPGRRGFEFKEG